MPASKTTESALVSQVMKEVFGVTSDQMSSLAMVSSQQNENIAAGSTESTTPVAEEEEEEEEEMEGMSRLLTDEEIRKIIGGASGNPTPAPLLGNFTLLFLKIACYYLNQWATFEIYITTRSLQVTTTAQLKHLLKLLFSYCPLQFPRQ